MRCIQFCRICQHWDFPCFSFCYQKKKKKFLYNHIVNGGYIKGLLLALGHFLFFFYSISGAFPAFGVLPKCHCHWTDRLRNVGGNLKLVTLRKAGKLQLKLRQQIAVPQKVCENSTAPPPCETKLPFSLLTAAVFCSVWLLFDFWLFGFIDTTQVSSVSSNW